VVDRIEIDDTGVICRNAVGQETFNTNNKYMVTAPAGTSNFKFGGHSAANAVLTSIPNFSSSADKSEYYTHETDFVGTTPLVTPMGEYPNDLQNWLYNPDKDAMRGTSNFYAIFNRQPQEKSKIVFPISMPHAILYELTDSFLNIYSVEGQPAYRNDDNYIWRVYTFHPHNTDNTRHYVNAEIKEGNTTVGYFKVHCFIIQAYPSYWLDSSYAVWRFVDDPRTLPFGSGAHMEFNFPSVTDYSWKGNDGSDYTNHVRTHSGTSTIRWAMITLVNAYPSDNYAGLLETP
jgi:hypothetical protein